MQRSRLDADVRHDPPIFETQPVQVVIKARFVGAHHQFSVPGCSQLWARSQHAQANVGVASAQAINANVVAFRACMFPGPVTGPS